ncbi:peptidoglycan-binding protein [Streptomyces sp. NPDC017991]|uniref:peptidoglycan-binding protein n=1 Tax=Streptomyces sp. NPDC017991 TaxID=3365026 RepID=UPI0037B245AC
MRVLARTLVSVTAALGIAAGGLATAGAGFAASAPTVKSAAISQEAAPLAVVNLGLNTTEAGYVQCWLKDFWSYTGAIDGQLGTNSWKAMQRNLKAHWGYTGAIDGIVGSGTVSGLQRSLKAHQGYTGPIDGIAGSGTQAAFKRFAADSRAFC